MDTSDDWTTLIKLYLENGILLDYKNKERQLVRCAAHYYIWSGDLYRRGFSMPCLRCLPPLEADYVLREFHEQVCASHQVAPALKRNVLQVGFYWPSIIRDANALVDSCDKHQRFANNILALATDMRPLTAPWPFDVWGLVILRPLPKASGQKKFFIVSVDLFTKWIEAKPVTFITTKAIETFVT